MTRPIQVTARALVSIVVAWLLWGGILNGSATIAQILGPESSIGRAFADMTVMFGAFGIGLPFFFVLIALVYAIIGWIVRRWRQQPPPSD
jgi:uncharacterized membrane protein YhaH (DUF805 family)